MASEFAPKARTTAVTRTRRFALLLAAAAPLALASACGGEAPAPVVPCPESPKSLGQNGDAGATSIAAATPEDARRFLSDIDHDLRRLWIMRDRAAWVNQNFITDDSEALGAAGEEATAEYVTRKILEAKRFDGLKLESDVSRQLSLLKLSQVVPAPDNEAERRELAEIQSSMTSTYGKGKFCPKRLGGACLTLDDLSRTLKKSRNPVELEEAWVGWHQIAPPMREKYARYVELGNKGAKEIGFSDMGSLWRSGYDMRPADFEADIERLWKDVKPLYEKLHCFVGKKLRAKYGKDKVPVGKPLPAHLLGNMWAQQWDGIYDIVEPFPNQGSLDVDAKLRAKFEKGEKDKKTLDAKGMVRVGESFFTSLGLDPLPQTFWDRSLFQRPKQRDVVCHASAWDVTWSNDLRIKMCIEPTEDDLITIHHELGHDYYFHYYYRLPILYQQGANDGFHEGIGDTLALSVTPDYLKSIGLLDAVPKNDKAKLNVQMKMALDKVAFLPFGLLIDKWRWDVFSGKTSRADYNKSWWELKQRYQGVGSPVARTENDFDPGAKFHIPGSTPYIRYFLARIYQFQFHRALCRAAGHKGSLETCSIFGNKEAGAKLRAMLSLGASKPWPEALAVLSGESRADASAMLEYFKPLEAFLNEQNKGETCGW
jgi:peptidyl-dipeptidase A